jgi:plastocyanin
MRAHPHFFRSLVNSAILLLVLVGLAVFPIILVSPHEASASNSTYSVSIVDYAFQPLHINITTGTMVTWTYSSAGATIHTVTSDPGTNTTQGGAPLLNSGDLSPGQSFSYTFNLPGYYPYQCAVHPTIPKMNGWVNVTGNPVTVPPPQNGASTWWVLPAGIAGASAVLVLAVWLILKRKKVASQKPSMN